MRPLAVLHVNTEAGWRGGEAQTLLLARGLRERGHASILLAPSGSAIAERAAFSGVEVRACPMRGEFDLAAVRALARLIRELKPSLLHYHTSHAITIGTLAGLLARPAVGRPPAVLTRRVSFSLRRNPLARVKYRFRIDHVIAVSDGVRWVLIAEGLPPDRVSVIHSGIDLSLFMGKDGSGRSVRREMGVPEEAVLVGSVGALVAHKGHAFLLESVAKLSSRRPEVHVALVGEGPLRAELEERARREALSGRVHFTGFRRDVPAVLSALDVFALPSISGEGSPAVVKEAMACRVPVVATELDGVREIVDEGREALLVPPGDPRRLAEAIEALIADEKLRERLVAAASVKVREYSSEKMVERTEEVYERILAAAGREA